MNWRMSPRQLEDLVAYAKDCEGLLTLLRDRDKARAAALPEGDEKYAIQTWISRIEVFLTPKPVVPTPLKGRFADPLYRGN